MSDMASRRIPIVLPWLDEEPHTCHEDQKDMLVTIPPPAYCNPRDTTTCQLPSGLSTPTSGKPSTAKGLDVETGVITVSHIGKSNTVRILMVITDQSLSIRQSRQDQRPDRAALRCSSVGRSIVDPQCLDIREAKTDSHINPHCRVCWSHAHAWCCQTSRCTDRCCSVSLCDPKLKMKLLTGPRYAAVLVVFLQFGQCSG